MLRGSSLVLFKSICLSGCLSGCFLGVLILGAACSSSKPASAPVAEKAETATQAPTTWQAKMQGLSTTLSDLLPMVASRAKFNNPKNLDRITADTQQLKTLAHSLKMGTSPNSDPTMRVMSSLFNEDLERALESLRGGNPDYSRQILKDTTAYCIECHTQTNNGPDFPRLSLTVDTNELSSLEQAEFFAATRQFGAALEAYKRVLADQSMAKTDPFAWEQAARSALAIVVRVKMDTKETGALLAKIEALPTLPVSTKRAIKTWKKSLKEWQKEPRKPLKTADQVLAKSNSLIDEAQKMQEFPLDHSEDLLYFRAASLLHDLLATQDRTIEQTARALYLSGIASEATRDMNFWTLHETYYEQCIQVLPHSKQAKDCYERLKDSVTAGYSGSSGTRVPPEVQTRLNNLHELATGAAPAPGEKPTPKPAPVTKPVSEGN